MGSDAASRLAGEQDHRFQRPHSLFIGQNKIAVMANGG